MFTFVNTNFMADLIFIKAIWDSDKYSFLFIIQNKSPDKLEASQVVLKKNKFIK